jgi:hypothetical protein
VYVLFFLLSLTASSALQISRIFALSARSSAMSTLVEISAQVLANDDRVSAHVYAISAIKASMPIQTLSDSIAKYR